ncbi:Dabb family protein [Alphaproteobacteria bacterium]|nr:Dabb family protein [Alphaproteobacteria bacterium]MDA8544272.1 Dabb family protein [Alphaproteobacteria bacterium]MDA8623975.1 Dabb family protein [Alphaproteobacteria bacterium]MDA8712838.1 Dabb family protein [Alphaproteobacteria bacterium]MDA9590386.1 Dabb family protein [Alphaproteobacteria bacterium]
MMRTSHMIAVLLALSVATPLHAAPATVFHTVIFWLKADTPAAKRDEIIRNTQSLEKLPMVEKVFVGQPIMSDRKVVDDSFSVAFTMTFKDEAALEAYNADPRHKKSSARTLPYVARGVIYDYK